MNWRNISRLAVAFAGSLIVCAMVMLIALPVVRAHMSKPISAPAVQHSMATPSAGDGRGAIVPCHGQAAGGEEGRVLHVAVPAGQQDAPAGETDERTAHSLPPCCSWVGAALLLAAALPIGLEPVRSLRQAASGALDLEGIEPSTPRKPPRTVGAAAAAA